MNRHFLSIIMPCYNCISTLEEALASVYTQELQIPFEVVMVDDASTDGTWKLMEELSKKYPHVRLLKHEKNRGGGAARNTAIAEARGDLIIPHDSDDIFVPKTLPKLVDCLDKHSCKAVAISEQRFFNGTNLKGYKPYYYKQFDRSVVLEDLFDGSNTYLGNFLFTKEACLAVDEYPEHHGFDTQSFEYRFLSLRSNTVFYCPDTAFYHRLMDKKHSYFRQVYSAGEYSKNYYLIYEDILYLFSRKVRNIILTYDIFECAKLGSDNILVTLNDLFAANPKEFFIPQYQEYLTSDGYEKFLKNFQNNRTPEDLLVLAIYHFRHKEYERSLLYLNELIKAGFGTKVAYYNILRNYLMLSGNILPVKADQAVLTLVKSMIFKPQKIVIYPDFLVRFFQHHPQLKSYLKKWLRVNT